MSLTFSLHLPSLRDVFETGLRRATALGFRHVDVAGVIDRPPSHLEALAESGLIVVAVDLVFALGRPLDDARRQIADAARLGATVGCLDEPLRGEAFDLLDRYAAGRMIRLCTRTPHSPPHSLVDRESRIAHVRLDVCGPFDEVSLAAQVERLCGTDYHGTVAVRLKPEERLHDG